MHARAHAPGPAPSRPCSAVPRAVAADVLLLHCCAALVYTLVGNSGSSLQTEVVVRSRGRREREKKRKFGHVPSVFTPLALERVRIEARLPAASNTFTPTAAQQMTDSTSEVHNRVVLSTLQTH